eukprot:9747054-Alexandrium_andersonii.AAC.1
MGSKTWHTSVGRAAPEPTVSRRLASGCRRLGSRWASSPLSGFGRARTMPMLAGASLGSGSSPRAFR